MSPSSFMSRKGVRTNPGQLAHKGGKRRAPPWCADAGSSSSSLRRGTAQLPKAWRGVRDDALSGLTGIPGCVFVHAAGFIGGSKTLEGAKEMAARGLAED